MEALRQYEEELLCPCGCGQLMEESHDPESAWAVDTFKCMARRAREAVEAKDREKHKDNPSALDGMFWYARPYDPERDLDRFGKRPGRRRRRQVDEN